MKPILLLMLVCIALCMGVVFFSPSTTYTTTDAIAKDRTPPLPQSSNPETGTGSGGVKELETVDLQVGDGKEAIEGKRLSVHYVGWVYDNREPDNRGIIFDTSRETSPFRFQLGAGQVIRGWDRGIVGMKVGGKRILTIPPDLAYGQASKGKIPANATLIFEVELLDVL